MQSVNLYLPEYRPKREWLSLGSSAIGFGVFLLLMLSTQLYQNQRLNQLNERVASLQQQEQETQDKVEQLKKQAARSDKRGLQQQVQQLRVAIENRHALKDVMAGSAMGNRDGFSGHLYVLGQKRSADLVLDHIAISRAGAYVELAGTAKSPASVPFYIHNLQQTSAFAEAKFGLLTIDERGGVARFRLSGDGPMEIETLQLHQELQLRR